MLSLSGLLTCPLVLSPQSSSNSLTHTLSRYSLYHGMGLITRRALHCMVPGIAKSPALYLILYYRFAMQQTYYSLLDYPSGAAREAMTSLGLARS